MRGIGSRISRFFIYVYGVNSTAKLTISYFLFNFFACELGVRPSIFCFEEKELKTENFINTSSAVLLSVLLKEKCFK